MATLSAPTRRSMIELIKVITCKIELIKREGRKRGKITCREEKKKGRIG